MFAIAGGIILLICLIPLIPAIFQIFWGILGLSVSLIAILVLLLIAFLFLNGTLPLDFLLYGFGLFVIFRFIAFLGSSSTGNVDNARQRTYSKVKNNVDSIHSLTPNSVKIEMSETVRKIIPAFSTNAKITKIKKLNQLNQQQIQYRKESIDYATKKLDELTQEVMQNLASSCKIYIDSEIIKIDGSERVRPNDKLVLGNDFHVLFGDAKTKIVSINIMTRPLSKTRVERKISLNLPEQQDGFYPKISMKKVLRKTEKTIIQNLKKNPILAEKIKQP